MFPNKGKMVRAVNPVLAALGIAPIVYLVEVVLSGGHGLARDQSLALVMSSAFIAASILLVAVTVFTQTQWRPKAGKANYDPITRTYRIVSTGAILSETHSIFGTVIALLYGSIFTAIGFSLVSWASLLWVRSKFKQNLEKIPNE